MPDIEKLREFGRMVEAGAVVVCHPDTVEVARMMVGNGARIIENRWVERGQLIAIDSSAILASALTQVRVNG